MFINVVITRVILFCPAVPPSPPSAPSLVPRNATSFVSLLAKLLVLRARLSLPAYVRERERGGGERVREKRSLTREFVLLVLSPFVSSTLSFFLLLSLFPLSRDSLSVSFVPYAAVSFSFFVDLFLLRSPRCYRSRVSPRSRSSFSSSPSAEELLSRWFSYSALSFFFSSFRPPALPRVAPFPSEFTPERVILPLTPRRLRRTVPPLLPLSASFFVPVDRGVLHSSNLNAGRTGVLYRLRK